MRVSELKWKLETILRKHGNIPVRVYASKGHTLDPFTLLFLDTPSTEEAPSEKHLVLTSLVDFKDIQQKAKEEMDAVEASQPQENTDEKV